MARVFQVCVASLRDVELVADVYNVFARVYDVWVDKGDVGVGLFVSILASDWRGDYDVAGIRIPAVYNSVESSVHGVYGGRVWG